jgi:hypothetical protein
MSGSREHNALSYPEVPDDAQEKRISTEFRQLEVV